MASEPLTTNTGNWDTSDKPSMGDADVVNGLVRAMFDEARKIMFEADQPQGEVPGLVERWAKTFSPANTDYIQTMNPETQAVFLRQRGFGARDPHDDFTAPLKAMLAWSLSRFTAAAAWFHNDKIDEAQLAFAIDTAAEDTSCLLRGVDNPAD